MIEPKANVESDVWDEPVLARDPAQLPAGLPRGGDIPEDLDPLAEGVLMRHQAEWLEDDSRLKICEKGRRTGITFAEALDDTLIAAAKRSAGGQNVFYIGDTKDKGREFIGYVARFAKTVANEVAAIEDGIFIDQRADGSSKFISSHIIRFASGFRVEALSSRPENIRGLQGTVVIDEAAFHSDVREVLDAVNALLIWRGKIRVISSHNGVLNPFNSLCKEAHAKKIPFSPHVIPFKAAVENGLFKRVCMVTGETWSHEAEVEWEAEIRASYGSRTAKMRQELDAIPAEAEGAALTRVLIESCMSKAIEVVRWDRPDEFKELPDHERRRQALHFCQERLDPLLSQLDKRREHAFGEDFGRTGDKTAIIPVEIGQDLVRRACFVLELKNIPFDQQRDILFYVADRLPRLVGGALDARGNGSYLAEVSRQRYGEIIWEVMFSPTWYRANMPPYIEAFADKTILLPADADVLADHQALAYVAGGYIKVPDDHSTKGNDGYDRHGDTAPAGALAFFASKQNPISYAYETHAPAPESRSVGFGQDDDDEGGRSLTYGMKGAL
jgi:phage FluMu gp28-like protein